GRFSGTGGADGGGRGKSDFPPVDKEKGFAILDVLANVAQARGATIPQIALAWLLANPAVTSVIIGARRSSQLDDNLKSVDVTLTPDDLKALDQVSRHAPAYPDWIDELRSR